MGKRLRTLRQRLTPGGGWVWLWLLLACALTGLAWSYLAFLLERQSIRIAFRAMLYPKFWLTALFFFALTALFTLLTNRLLAGGLLAWAPFLILGIINAYKLAITDTALSLNDLALAGNLGGIVKLNAAALVPSSRTVLTVVGTLLWGVVLWFFAPPLRLPSHRRAALSSLAPLGVLVGVFWLGLDPLVLRPMGIGLDWGNLSQTLVNQYTGQPLGFSRSLKARQVWARPMGDSELSALLDQAEDELPAQPAAEDAVHPNVILILSESFFDVTELPGVTYDTDPIPQFHALQAEGVSGHFYTRTLGYGTCDIELEVLTGVNTHLLSDEDLYSMDPRRLSQVPAVPKLLRQAGYRAVMLHMYPDGIYDRAPLMDAIGFEQCYFSDDFTPIDPQAAQAPDYNAYIQARQSGTYPSDAYMTDLLTGLYQRKEEDGPLFTFAISMENHSPHTGEKYAEEELSVSFSGPLTEEATQALAAASQGCANASQALGQLCDFFRDYDEPTIILFYGDHRPGLGVEGDGLDRVYSQLYDAAGDWAGFSSLEQIAQQRETSYLIWANDPSLLPAQPGSRADTSCNYFGLSVLEAAGVQKPLYWRLLEQLSQSRLIDTAEYTLGVDHVPSLAMPMEGEVHSQLTRMSAILQSVLYDGNPFAQRLGT